MGRLKGYVVSQILWHSIYYNLRIWIINHKHSEEFSSLFMQAYAKGDLYDTSRTIKVDVDGPHGISRENTES